MRKLEIWIVFNNRSGESLVVQTKRLAKRIVLFGNKFTTLANRENIYCAQDYREFFKDHEFDKSKIFFHWDASIEEKMEHFKKFQEIGAVHENAPF